MSAFDPVLIRKIVSSGRAIELHAILLGISPYCVGGPHIRYRVPPTPEEQLLCTLAIHHLDFVAHHGLQMGDGWAGERYLISHAAEFEEWLQRGAPGLVWEDVLAYLRDKPIP